MAKRLYRSRQHSVFGGVCGGIAEYFDIDPVFVRIIAAVLILAHGIGLIAYLICLIAMPKAPADVVETPSEPSQIGKYLPGIILIVIGAVFLMNNLFWWFHWHHFWPVLLIIAGGALIWRSVTHRNHNNGGVHESV